MDDPEDVETIRLALWALFAVGRSAAANDGGTFRSSECAEHADELLRQTERRFPFLRQPEPPDPTGGLAPRAPLG